MQVLDYDCVSLFVWWLDALGLVVSSRMKCKNAFEIVGVLLWFYVRKDTLTEVHTSGVTNQIELFNNKTSFMSKRGMTKEPSVSCREVPGNSLSQEWSCSWVTWPERFSLKFILLFLCSLRYIFREYAYISG